MDKLTITYLLAQSRADSTPLQVITRVRAMGAPSAMEALGPFIAEG